MCQEARMAEDESKKKRGKRKGLGGLTPEKKKKLKVTMGQAHNENLFIYKYCEITFYSLDFNFKLYIL